MKFLLAFVDKFCDEHTHHTHDFSLESGQVRSPKRWLMRLMMKH